MYFESENERRWNTPPKLTPEQADGKSNFDNESPQPRFLPFSASFTLSSGGTSNNAHSLSVGGSEDGISFSQSASQAAGSAGIEGYAKKILIRNESSAIRRRGLADPIGISEGDSTSRIYIINLKFSRVDDG